MRLANACKVLSYDAGRSCLMWSAGVQSEDILATIVVFGSEDLDLLVEIAHMIDARQEIRCLYSAELLLTMIADAAGVTGKSQELIGRAFLTRDDSRVRQAGSLFPELHALDIGMLRELGLFGATSLLSGIIRAIRLLAFSGMRLPPDAELIFRHDGGDGLIGAIEGEAFIYDGRADVMRKFALESELYAAEGGRERDTVV